MKAFADCACFNTRRAARLLSKAYDRALEPTGLTNTQFTALAAIVESRDGMIISELAGRMGVDRTTLTRNLALMERDGLVRVAPGADPRSRVASLTRTGRDAFCEAVPLWNGIQRSVTTAVDDWEALQSGLQSLARVAPRAGVGEQDR